MAKLASEVVTIIRNVTGRVDATDPLFSDQIMLGYLQDFISLEMPQEVRLTENRTWYDFTISNLDPDPYPVSLQGLHFSTIEPPAYISDILVPPNQTNSYQLAWYQDPSAFYAVWPVEQEFTPQRPTYVLWYNNELTFRGPPDKQYNVRIAAYTTELVLNGASYPVTGATPIANDYIWRYAAYGASLDIFTDYGEIDNFNKFYPIFKRYRSMVYARTNAQYQNQRSYPQF